MDSLFQYSTGKIQNTVAQIAVKKLLDNVGNCGMIVAKHNNFLIILN